MMKYSCHSYINDLYAWWKRRRERGRGTERERDKSPKRCDDTLQRSLILFLFIFSFFSYSIDRQTYIMFRNIVLDRDIEKDCDNWFNKSVCNVIKRSIFEWYISYKFIYIHLIIDVYFLHFSFFLFLMMPMTEVTHTYIYRYRYTWIW